MGGAVAGSGEDGIDVEVLAAPLLTEQRGVDPAPLLAESRHIDGDRSAGCRRTASRRLRGPGHRLTAVRAPALSPGRPECGSRRVTSQQQCGIPATTWTTRRPAGRGTVLMLQLG